MPEAVIAAAARSPIGRAFKGSLRTMRPDDLAVQMLAAALAQVPQLDPGDIDDLVLGCGQPEGEAGFNLARVVAVLAGLDGCPGTTVNRFCASSLQATRMAFHAIKAGEGEVFVAAGVEAVSRYGPGGFDEHRGTENPAFAAARRRSELRSDGGAVWEDPRASGALPDVYLGMGQTAENVAQLTGVGRQEQDAFAVESQRKAQQAAADGFWERDITPVTLADGTRVERDDCPRAGVTLESLARLVPVFRPGGTVTAGNACPLNDGAAALVVMSDDKAADLGVTPLARIVSTGVSALSPEIMGLGPVEASEQALARAGLTVEDMDLVEINEAFAAQVIPSARRLGVDPGRLNVHGGAIALGHPFGMTGARMITTTIHALQERDARHALLTMCIGGGQGMALVLERLG